MNRLLAMVTILSRSERIQAKELARAFEVSVRTIYRDVDILAQAGIPVITYPGSQGGVALMPGSQISRLPFTQDELDTLQAGLKGMNSVSADKRVELLMQKLSLPMQEDSSAMRIDLGTHGKESLSEKIAQLRQAITERRVVEVAYYSKSGASLRKVEPIFVAYKWSDWYLLAYCRLRDEFRTFKLKRMDHLTITDEIFVMRPVPPEKTDLEAFYAQSRLATLKLNRSLEYAAVDEYGVGSYEVKEDGLIAHWDYTDEREMVKRVLALGSGARVLEPHHLAQAVRDEAKKIYDSYGKDDI